MFITTVHWRPSLCDKRVKVFFHGIWITMTDLHKREDKSLFIFQIDDKQVD